MTCRTAHCRLPSIYDLTRTWPNGEPVSPYQTLCVEHELERVTDRITGLSMLQNELYRLHERGQLSLDEESA